MRLMSTAESQSANIRKQKHSLVYVMILLNIHHKYACFSLLQVISALLPRGLSSYIKYNQCCDPLVLISTITYPVLGAIYGSNYL